MKELLKFVSNDGTWVIQENTNGGITLEREVPMSLMPNKISFTKEDFGSLIGLLGKFEQKLYASGK